MLRVLIVDDEQFVREGLKIVIDWEKYGFTVCGEGEDGIDGFEKAIELKPDLILADIRMPGLSGIEMTEKLNEGGFTGKIIILTGYSDFKNAQSAINLGVKSYLLKPIDEDELIESIEKVKQEILHEKKVEKYIEESKSEIYQNIVKKIINGNFDINKIEKDIELYGLEINHQLCRIAIIDFYCKDKTLRYRELLRESINSFISKSTNQEVLTIDEKLVVMFVGKTLREIADILSKLKEVVKNTFDCNLFIGVGREVENIYEINCSYKDAKEIIKKKFIYEELYIKFYDEINPQTLSNYDGILNVKKLYTAIEIDDVEQIKLIMNTTKNVLMASELLPENIKGLFINWLIELNGLLLENYSEFKDIIPSKDEVMNNIYSAGNLTYLVEYMIKECSTISASIASSSSDNIMKRVISYIEKNYYQDIKLELLAQIFKYNSAYLGRAFKSYTNESFNVYLDKVRIEHAKSLLLNSELKVYEISEKVGYNNIDYFYSKFKKYVGVSTKEFKKIGQDDSQKAV